MQAHDAVRVGRVDSSLNGAERWRSGTSGMPSPMSVGITWMMNAADDLDLRTHARG